MAYRHVSRETGGLVDLTAGLPGPGAELLAAFAALLATRGVELGAIGPHEAGRVVERHIEDSLRAVDCFRPEDRRAADLGSGAGLPGIPLAIALPSLEFVLIERMARRAAFLELVIETLAVPNVSVRVSDARSTTMDVDVCTARAVADPASTWELAAPLMGARGRLIYFAGRTWTHVGSREALPRGVDLRVCAPARFPDEGPLVMMQRLSRRSPSEQEKT
jgi:16S rRNA (guanine527-N7)-methyltransferase